MSNIHKDIAAAVEAAVADLEGAQKDTFDERRVSTPPFNRAALETTWRDGVTMFAGQIRSCLAEIDRLTARCDRIANDCVDTMAAVLANYQTVLSEMGAPRSMSEVMAQVEEAMEASLKRLDCPEQAERRERFKNKVHEIAIETKNREIARLTAKLEIHLLHTDLLEAVRVYVQTGIGQPEQQRALKRMVELVELLTREGVEVLTATTLSATQERKGDNS